MLQLYKTQKAIKFATKTHEVYQKQKRKGKDISYITHPLTVGLILSQIGAIQDVVCAGILHDTMEDCTPEKKVTFEMLEERFGTEVAQMVLDVTETDKTLSWEERKKQALEHVKTFSHDSLLVKSADVVSNLSEMVDDYEKDGDQIFLRFNASKDRKIKTSLEMISAIISRWSENPLARELRFLADKLQMMGGVKFMTEYPAKIIEYVDYDDEAEIDCPICNWHGSIKDCGGETYDTLLDVACPVCDKMLLIVNYPTVQM